MNAMHTKIIKSEDEYNRMVAEVERLMDSADSDAVAHDRLELLSLLVQKYEDENFPVAAVSPQDVVKFVQSSRGSTRPAGTSQQ